MIPIMLYCLAYVLGILWGLYTECMALFCLILCFLIMKQKWKVIVICIIVFILAGCYTRFKISMYDNKYNDGDIIINAKIISDVIEKENTNSYILKSDSNDKFIMYVDKEKELKYGMKIIVEGEYDLPDTSRNRGGYNYRRYLNSQNIYGSIYAEKIEITDLPSFDFIYSIRKSIENTFDKMLPREHVGILQGMIIGDTSYISDETIQNFRDSGISHLLAVSGSNVVYILVVCKFIFEKIFGRNISNVLTIAFIILFMLISGGSASVVRATIMATLTIVSEFFSRKPNVFASISFAALCTLVYNPLIIYDVGFALSFARNHGNCTF